MQGNWLAVARILHEHFVMAHNHEAAQAGIIELANDLADLFCGFGAENRRKFMNVVYAQEKDHE